MKAGDLVRTGALIVQRPQWGSLVCSGPDRQKWLQGVVSCDVAGLRPGQGNYGLVLTHRGKILTDICVLTAPDAVYLSTAPGRAEQVSEHLDRLLVMEDAELRDASAELTWVTIHGPGAASLALGQAERSRGAHAGCIAWPGLGGAALVVARSDAETRVSSLLEQASGPALRADARQWEQVRIEHGWPEFGVDYDEHSTPHEASLERVAVSFSKGCYVGQEVVYRQDARGVTQRRLVSLRLEGEVPPASRTPVLAAADERPVGEVTSSALSERTGSPVAIARVKAAYCEPDTALTVAGLRAIVVEPTRPAAGTC